MPKQLIVFPFGGNAREALAVIHRCNQLKKEWEILGFIDDNPSLLGKQVNGVTVLGGRDILKEFPDSKVLAVPGNPEDYLKRRTIIDGLEIDANRFAQVIDPSVFLAPDAEIGTNILLMANVVLGSRVSLGSHCVILANTVIGHDSQIGDYCCVGSNVSIAGFVAIGTNCYIGSGSAVRDHIAIGDNSLIGLGSSVISNVENGTRVAGNPAKKIEPLLK